MYGDLERGGVPAGSPMYPVHDLCTGISISTFDPYTGLRCHPYTTGDALYVIHVRRFIMLRCHGAVAGRLAAYTATARATHSQARTSTSRSPHAYTYRTSTSRSPHAKAACMVLTRIERSRVVPARAGAPQAARPVRRLFRPTDHPRPLPLRRPALPRRPRRRRLPPVPPALHQLGLNLIRAN